MNADGRRSAGWYDDCPRHTVVTWSRRMLTATILLQGGALLVLVCSAGTPVWQLARGAVVAAATASVVAVQRAHSRLFEPMLVLFGLIGLVTGIGIGIDNYLQVRLTVASGAGLATFATGSTMLAVGTARLVWRLPRPLRLPIGVATLVAFRFVTLPILVMPVAFAVSLTNVPHTSLDAVSPYDVGFAFEDVTFRATDGTELSGWFIPSASGATVILLHGAMGNRSDVLDHAAVLARHGYAVLLFDARGHGRSGGHAMDFGWYGDLDIGGAVSYLSGRPDVDPELIAVVGLSLGGEMAIGAAATDERIKAVVAEGATYRVRGDWTPHRAEGWLEEVMDWVTFTAADLLSAADPPITLRDAVVAMAPRPLLLIEGEDGVETSAGRDFRAASPSNVQLWELPDTHHIGGLDTHPGAWAARVTAFLDHALDVRP